MKDSAVELNSVFKTEKKQTEYYRKSSWENLLGYRGRIRQNL